MISNAEMLDILALAHALIRDSDWYHGGLRGDLFAGVSYCLITALSAAQRHLRPDYPRFTDNAVAFPYALFSPLVPEEFRNLNLSGWNDSRKRKRDVLRLIEQAAARLSK